MNKVYKAWRNHNGSYDVICGHVVIVKDESYKTALSIRDWLANPNDPNAYPKVRKEVAP